MNTHPRTASPKRPLSMGDKTSLLTQAQVIKRDIPAAARSLASRARVKAHVNKLCDQVLELDPPEAIEEQSRAMLLAMDNHEWEQLIAVCETFALAVEGKPIAPIGETPVPSADPVALAPAPIITAPLSIADPVPDHTVPVHAPADPVQAHDGVNDQGDATPANALPAAPIAATPMTAADPVQEPDVPALAPAVPDRDHANVVYQAHVNTADDPPAAPALLATVEQLGEAIRLARTGKRMTQQQAATAAGVGRRFVIELERGKATAEFGCVLALCRAVGVALTALPA